MQVGKNGKKIPLDPATELPHDCPMRDKPSVPKEEKKSFDEVAEQIRNDHGNEAFPPTGAKKILELTPEGMNLLKGAGLGYVDHTLKPKLKYRTITDPTPEGYDHKLNDFAQTHNIHYTQTHIAGSLYVAVVMYEELK
jgi:hypothetical protein